MEGEGEADRSDVEHLHDGDGGDSSAVPERVFAELGGGIAIDVGDGDLARVDLRVESEGDEVADSVDGASQEVEARAEVSHRCGCEGLDGGEEGLGFCNEGFGRE